MTAQPAASSTRATLIGVAVLAVTLATATGIALTVGSGDPRWPRAVAFASAITAVGSLGGWLAARVPPANPAMALAGGLGATALRIIPPLAGLAWLAGRGAPLREAGAGGLLVGFYLALLATAILLHIMVAPVPVSRPLDRPR